MPPVVIGAAVSGIIAGVFGGAAAFATVFFTTLILGAVSLALQPDIDLEGGSVPRNTNVIQPITYRAVIYGETRVSGPIIFLDTTNDNSRLHFIVPLAGHEVEAIEDVFFNGENIELDGSGNAIGKFAGLVRIKKHLGTSSQAADPDLVAESTFWTTAHQGLDIAYLYVRLIFNEKKFSRIPDVTAIVKGKKVFDTRDSGTRWTRNSALIRRDYLTNTYYGMSVPTAFINDASVTEAANIDDELIDVQQKSDNFTVSVSTNLYSRLTLRALWLTGDVVQLTTSGTLPAPLALATDYFIIIKRFKKVAGSSITTFKLASSHANAIAGTVINITDTGAGTHTITRMQEVRYTIDGSFEMNIPHEEVLKRMNTASYGKMIYSGGTWFIHSGAFRSPTVEITEDDLRGPIQLQTLLAKSELANGVTGVYISPYNDWQPREFPSVISSTFVTEDGETINKDVRLPLTGSTGMAQRIAKIELLRIRQQQTVILPCKLTVLDTKAGDTIQFTYSRFGFSLKEFEIIDWKFSFGSDVENPALGIDIVGREVASTDYDFETSEEQIDDPSEDTNLPNPFVVVDPTGLTLLSGTAQLYLRLDGTVMSRIRAEWTAPADAFVTDNGHIEIQFKRSADSEWQKAASVRGDEVFTFLLDVEDGVAYDVRIQSVNHFGVKNDTWVTETNHTVIGKTTVPADVTVFSAQQNRDVVTFSWGQVVDVDLSGYEIRFAKRGIFVWETASAVTEVTKGTLVTNTALPPGDWTVGIKAVDTSGNESAGEKQFDIIVTSSFDIIVANEEHPRWLGMGSSLSFTGDDAGANQFVSITPAVDTRGDLTLEANIRASSLSIGAKANILRVGISSDNAGMLFYDQGNESIGFEWYDGVFNSIRSPNGSAPKELKLHVASVRESNVVTFLINGLVVGSPQAVTTPTVAPVTTRIGASSTTGQQFIGEIDNSRHWDDARTTAEVFDNMHRRLDSKNEPNLVGHWRFDEGSGSTAIDSSLSGNDGAITGATYDRPLHTGGFIRHDVSGRIVPNSNSLADAVGFEIFDQFVYDPIPIADYESVEIDIGFDADGLRVWGDTLAALGPDETGIAETPLSIDYRDDAAAYDGFEPWIIGSIDARFILGRITMDTSVGLGYAEEFTFTVDIEERTERDENVTIAVAGTTIFFSETFHTIPNMQTTVSAGSGLFAIVSSVTTTSFVVTVFNSSGADVGGNINWLATGA